MVSVLEDCLSLNTLLNLNQALSYHYNRHSFEMSLLLQSSFAQVSFLGIYIGALQQALRIRLTDRLIN